MFIREPFEPEEEEEDDVPLRNIIKIFLLY